MNIANILGPLLHQEREQVLRGRRIRKGIIQICIVVVCCLGINPMVFGQQEVGPSIEFFRSSETAIDTVRPVALSWKVSNAYRVDIHDGYRNLVLPALGNENYIEVWPELTATYTLTAYHENGQRATQALTIAVAPPRIDQFYASTPVLYSLEPVRIFWRVSGGQRISLFDATKNITYSDLAKENSLELFPEKTTIYTLTVMGPGNYYLSQQITVAVFITPTIDYFTAAPFVVEPGQASELRWQVRNAKRVDLQGGDPFVYVENLPLIGNYAVWPQRSSLYNLRVTSYDDLYYYYRIRIEVPRAR